MHILSSAALAMPQREPGDDLVLCAVNLAISQCAELCELADLYDTLVDRLRAESDVLMRLANWPGDLV